MNPIVKSRDLSLVDFYSILQREYISYFVRSKIYPKEYAKKYENYCICKKDKIDKIGIKNCLPSIFNMVSLREKYFDDFFNDYGLPNFEYRDEISIKIMGRYDKEYFFSEGTSIKIKTDKEIVLSTVIKNLSNTHKVIAEAHGEVKPFGYEFISRIISDNLINF
jgi:hypothetical protein